MLNKSIPLILALGVAGAGLLVGGIFDARSYQHDLFGLLLGYLGVAAGVASSRVSDAAAADAWGAGAVAIAGFTVISHVVFRLPV